MDLDFENIQDFELSELSKLDQPILSGYILWFLGICQNTGSISWSLAELFVEFFQKWTLETFDKTSKLSRQMLCKHLIKEGVYTPKGEHNAETLSAELVFILKADWNQIKFPLIPPEVLPITLAKLATPEPVKQPIKQPAKQPAKSAPKTPPIKLIPKARPAPPVPPAKINTPPTPPAKPAAHQKYHPPTPHDCNKCKESFPSNSALHHHLPLCQPLYKCTKCTATFASSNKLHQHIRDRKCCRKHQEEPESPNPPEITKV